MNIPGGFFITFEGIEGCGKTTQSRLLADYLRGRGMDVTQTREPGGTEIGRRIRAILLDPESRGITGLTELLLYSADRAQHLADVVEPALERGGVIVCDRYADATAAYQGYARGLDMEVINTLTAIATRGCKPDMTLLLDLPVTTGLRRAIGRNNNDGSDAEARFEQEAEEFHERVRQGYLGIARCEADRVKVIDAAGSVEEIQNAVRDAVDTAIAGKL